MDRRARFRSGFPGFQIPSTIAIEEHWRSSVADWPASCRRNHAKIRGIPRENPLPESVNLLISEKTRPDWQEFR